MWMNLYACMCVYVHVCLYGCFYTCGYVCIYVLVWVCVSVYVGMCVYTIADGLDCNLAFTGLSGDVIAAVAILDNIEPMYIYPYVYIIYTWVWIEIYVWSWRVWFVLVWITSMCEESKRAIKSERRAWRTTSAMGAHETMFSDDLHLRFCRDTITSTHGCTSSDAGALASTTRGTGTMLWCWFCFHCSLWFSAFRPTSSFCWRGDRLGDHFWVL
jgi:hypothetical protein